MIRTISNYNYITPFVSPLTGEICTSYTLKLYIWTGLKTDVPVTATYSVTITNSNSSSGNSTIPLNAYINDYISLNHSTVIGTQLSDSNRGVWIRITVEYLTPDASDTGVLYASDTTFAGAGYSFGDEGLNVVSVPEYLAIDGREFNVARNSRFIVPIYCQNEDLQKLSVYSYPDNEMTHNITKTISNHSNEVIQYLSVDTSETNEDTTIEIAYGDLTPQTIITLNVIDEQRYQPTEIVFVNRYGCDQSITLFKERKDKVKITNQSFKSNGGQPADGYHQSRTINPNGSKSFSAYSGWVDESFNDTLTELMLTKRCWERIGDQLKPLKVLTQSTGFKNTTNDDLIQYSIEFEYAFDLINTI